MTDTTRRFVSAIDRSCDAERSVVVRYRDAIRFEPEEARDRRFKELLCKGSLREGIRVVPYIRYRDVDLSIFDETSLMSTNTLKSIDGCVTTARCLLDGRTRIAFESGANTGTALTVYGQRAGLETFFFVPKENLSLLDSKTFLDETAHLISVSDPSRLKSEAARFAESNGLVHVPKPQWRYEASMLIGCYLLEHLLDGARYDYLVQSISAAFAPIGIYRVLREHRGALPELPSFIGIQQAANCPMVRAWRNGQTQDNNHAVRATSDLLSKVMYDGRSHTYGTFEEFQGILKDVGGDLAAIDRDEFDATLTGSPAGETVRLLSEKGIEIGVRDGDIVEKTGLMALAGTMKQIDEGKIAPGSRVLVCMTGGAGVRDGAAVPTQHLDDTTRQDDKLSRHGVG